MADPFIGELKIMAFGFAPKGWAQANGQVMALNQNQALFSLFGTQYGGNGIQTFALPNLQGRTALHQGGGFTIGQSGGTAVETLAPGEFPAHSHLPQANSGAGGTPGLIGNSFGKALVNAYGPGANVTPLVSTTTATGASASHENRMPSSVLNICVALQGIFPSRN